MNQQNQTKQAAELAPENEVELKDDELQDSELEKVAAGSRPNCSTPLSTGADASTDFRKH